MALSLPAFIGMALAQAAMGAAAGSARRQLEVDKEGREAVLKLLQQGVHDRIAGGIDVPDELGKQAYGNNWKNLKPYMADWAAGMRAHQAQQQQILRSTGVLGPEAGAAPQAPEGLGSVASPASQMVASMAGAGTPQEALMPAGAQPPPVPTTGEPVPQPSVSTRMIQPSPLLPVPDAEVANLLRGVQRVGSAKTATVSPGPGLSLNVNMEENTRHAITTNAFAQGASPSSLAKAWSAAGVAYNDQTFKAYVTQHAGRVIPQMAAEIAGPRRARPTQDDYKQAALSYTAIHGAAVPAEVAALFPTPADSEAWFVRQFAGSTLGPTQLIEAHQRLIGSPLSQQTVEQIMSVRRAQVEQAVLAANPALAQNPAALAAAVQARVGSEVARPDQRAAATAEADVGAETSQAMQRAGIAPQLKSGLGAPGSPTAPGGGAPGPAPKPGSTIAEQFFRTAQQEKVLQAGRQAEATAIGSAAGKEAARPHETLPEEERLQRVDPITLQAVPPGTKRGEVEGPNARLKNYQAFSGKPEILAGIGRLRRVQRLYDESLEDLKPLMEKGSLSTFATKAGIVGAQVGLKGTPLQFTIPAGVLSDARTRANIKSEFPNLTDAQINRFLRALVDLDTASKESLSVLRSPLFDEKGNIRGDIVDAGTKALPSLNDNFLTATTKAENFRMAREAFEASWGLTRIPVVNDKGVRGTWDYAGGPVPEGYKRVYPGRRPAGWR